MTHRERAHGILVEVNRANCAGSHTQHCNLITAALEDVERETNTWAAEHLERVSAFSPAARADLLQVAAVFRARAAGPQAQPAALPRGEAPEGVPVRQDGLRRALRLVMDVMQAWAATQWGDDESAEASGGARRALSEAGRRIEAELSPQECGAKRRCGDRSVWGGCQRGAGHDGGHCSYDIDDAVAARAAPPSETPPEGGRLTMLRRLHAWWRRWMFRRRNPGNLVVRAYIEASPTERTVKP